MAWAVLMAGGSCPSIFVHDETFLSDVAKMKVEKLIRILIKTGKI